jgi:hypothetical protein
MALFLEDPESKMLYSKIVANVTQKELDQLTRLGMEDGDGRIDVKEFILLISLRVGCADAALLNLIADRFQQLDRMNEQKISYDDFVFGRRRSSLGKGKGSVVAPAPPQVQTVEDLVRRRSEIGMGRRTSSKVGAVISGMAGVNLVGRVRSSSDVAPAQEVEDEHTVPISPTTVSNFVTPALRADVAALYAFDDSGLESDSVQDALPSPDSDQGQTIAAWGGQGEAPAKKAQSQDQTPSINAIAITTKRSLRLSQVRLCA